MKWLILVLSLVVAPVQAQKTEKAIFAAGCFWCTEEAFEHVPGVVSAVSGYTGGSVKNPSYEQVSSGRTAHADAVSAPTMAAIGRRDGAPRTIPTFRKAASAWTFRASRGPTSGKLCRSPTNNCATAST